MKVVVFNGSFALQKMQAQLEVPCRGEYRDFPFRRAYKCLSPQRCSGRGRRRWHCTLCETGDQDVCCRSACKGKYLFGENTL